MKKTKKSKRHRKSPFLDEYDSKYGKPRSSKDALPSSKLVEYSDVSSEDFSAPEAGEIQDEEIAYTYGDNNCHKYDLFIFILFQLHFKKSFFQQQWYSFKSQ